MSEERTPAAGVTSGSANHCTTAPPVVTSDVDAVYDSHVGNRARFVSHDVVYFIFSVSIRASPWPSPPCFLLKLCGHDLEMLPILQECLLFNFAGPGRSILSPYLMYVFVPQLSR